MMDDKFDHQKKKMEYNNINIPKPGKNKFRELFLLLWPFLFPHRPK